MGMAMAFFEESFDTPYRAIPFYLLVGMAMAPALLSTSLNVRGARAAITSAAPLWARTAAVR